MAEFAKPKKKKVRFALLVRGHTVDTVRHQRASRCPNDSLMAQGCTSFSACELRMAQTVNSTRHGSGAEVLYLLMEHPFGSQGYQLLRRCLLGTVNKWVPICAGCLQKAECPVPTTTTGHMHMLSSM